MELSSNVSSFNITALVRSKDKADIIKSLNIGVDTVTGSNDDLAKLEDLSSKADYVFSIVSGIPNLLNVWLLTVSS